MENSILKNLNVFFKDANYEEAYKYILEKKLTLKDKDALIVFSFCAKSMSVLKPESSIDYLLKILQTLQISKLEGENLLNYLRCVFTLVKILIEKNEVEAVVELEHLIYPNFILTKKTEKQISYFKSIWGVLHVYIAKISKVETRPAGHILVNLCRIATKVIQESSAENLTATENYISFLLLNAPIEKVYDYILEVFGSISKGIFEIKKETFPAFKSLLKNISSFIAKDNGIVEEILTESLKALQVCCDKKLLLFIKKTIEVLKEDDLTGVLLSLQTLNWMLNVLKRDQFLEEFAGFLISVFKIQFKKEWKKGVWLEIMTEEVLMELSEFIESLGEIVTKKKVECCCKLKVNSCGAGSYVTLLTSIGKTNLQFGRIYENYYSNLLKILERACTHVKDVKAAKCAKLSQLWMEIGRVYYNLAIGLFKDKAECADLYLQNIIRNIFTFEGIENELIAKNITINLFEVYIDYYYKSENFQQGLYIGALFFSIYKNEKGLRQFISCKEKLPDSKHLSIISVLKDKESFYKKIYPDFKPLNDDEALEVSMKELEVYNNIWPSRKAIVGVYTDLFDFINPTTFAMCLTKISPKILVNSQSSIYEIICKLIQKLKDQNFEHNFCWGFIYFIKYKCEIATAIELNKQEMLNKDVQPLVALKDEVEDENDHCDVTANSNSLHMDNFITIIKNLLLSTKYFLVCNINEFDEEAMNVLNDLAHTLKLQYFKIEAVKVSIQILKIAEHLKKYPFYIQNCGYVLENLDTKSSLFKSIVKNVEKKYVKEITEEIRDQVLLSYYTMKGFSYYKSLDYKNCVKMYEKAMEHYYELDNKSGTELEILKAQYLLLKSLILILPCIYSVEGHQDSGIIAPVHTYKFLITSLKTHPDLNSHFLCLVFEATEVLLKHNLWMRFPREVRCYGKEIMILAQKLILPLRTTRLLIYLANADLLSCNYDDCQVKLNDISEILALKKIKCDKILKKEVDSKSSIKFDEIILECPRMRANAGSPILYEEPFTLPQFLKHEHCDCIQCTCPEYQVLVLRKVHLDAIFSESYHSTVISDGYFQGCFAIYKRIKQLHSEVLQDLEFEVNKRFFTLEEKYDVVRFDYLRQRFKEHYKSEKYRKELEAFPKSTNFHLNEEVDTLKEVFAVDEESLIKPFVIRSTPKLPSNTSPSISVAKTPENKLSQIQIPKSNQGHISPIHKIKVAKKILFGLESPQFQVPKTPAGFKIYTPKISAKKTAKKKENLEEAASSTVDKSDEFCVPQRRTIRKNLVSDLKEDEKGSSAVKTYKGRVLRSRKIEKDVDDLNAKFDELFNFR